MSYVLICGFMAGAPTPDHGHSVTSLPSRVQHERHQRYHNISFRGSQGCAVRGRRAAYN